MKAEVTGAQLGARRSVFIEVNRQLPLNVLSTFDQPVMTPNCAMRSASTVAPQSLWFLNDQMIVDLSRRLAGKLLRGETLTGEESPTEQRQISEASIRGLFVSLFAEKPNDEELAICLDFVEQQRQLLMERKSDADNANQLSLATLVQTLLASNRFLYID